MKRPSQIRFDESPVHAVVRRRRLIDGSTALLTGLAVGVAAIMGLAYLDLTAAWPELKRLWLLGITVAGVLLLVLQRWLVGRKGRNPLAVVKAMEATNPADGQLLRTAWELSGKGVLAPTGGDRGILSSRLLGEAEERLRRGKWQALAPSGRLLVWLALGASWWPLCWVRPGSRRISRLPCTAFCSLSVRLLTPRSPGSHHRHAMMTGIHRVSPSQLRVGMQNPRCWCRQRIRGNGSPTR